MEEIVFTKNQKGGDSLLHDGYRYNKNIISKNTTNWRCVNRRKFDCNASITLNTSNEIVRVSDHVCARNHDENQVILAMNKCKEEVCKNFSSVPKLLEACLEDLEGNGVNELPAVKQKQDAMYRARRRFLKSDDTNHFGIPKVLAKDFLVCDDDGEDGNDKILIFSTDVCTTFTNIFSTGMFFGDGTFMSAPSPYAQLYVIHIDLGSNEEITDVIPVVYGLLPNKKLTTYIRFFTLLRDELDIDIRQFKADYEVAAIRAIQNVFPSAEISACYFHFSKAVWKNGKKHGCSVEKDERRMVRLAANLPLLPEKHMREGWRSILKISPKNNRTKNFIKYYEKQWLDDKYALKIISVAGKRHRTNNPAEGWNRRINARINRNPHLYEFLFRMKKEAQICERRIKRFVSTSKSRIKSIRRKADIGFDNVYKQLLSKLEKNNITPLNFLRKITFLLLLK